jgi:membrane protein YqaA with SNARE-associated domain
MVATIVPFGSEIYFSTLLATNNYNSLLLLISASIGNILGSVFNWICGYYAAYFIKKKWLPINQNQINRAADFFLKYGKWSLLLSWVPFIGDPITFVAGSLRYSIIPFFILVSIGKVGRYLVVYFSVLWAINIF